MKKEIVLLFLLAIRCTFEDEDYDDNFYRDNMMVTDRYGSETFLLYEGGILKFSCAINVPVFFLDGDNFEPVDESLLLKVNSSKFGLYSCGGKTDSEALWFSLNYLLCDDYSETCQKLSCPVDQDSRSFCVIRPTNLAPSTCSPLTSEDCEASAGETFTYFGDKVCKSNSDKKKPVPFCEGLSKVKEHILYEVAPDASCTESNEPLLSVKTSTGTNLYLGHVGRLGSELFITFDKTTERIEVVERVDAEIKENLTYNNVLKSFTLPFKQYSALTKVLINQIRSEGRATTYFYNVRLNSSVEMKQDEKIALCSFIYPPIQQQQKLFKLHLVLKLNETVINESYTQSVIASVTSCGNYSCEAKIQVKKCNPFYIDSDHKIETLSIITDCGPETISTPTVTLSAAKTSPNYVWCAITVSVVVISTFR